MRNICVKKMKLDQQFRICGFKYFFSILALVVILFVEGRTVCAPCFRTLWKHSYEISLNVEMYSGDVL